MDLNINFIALTCCLSNCGISWAQPKTYDDKKREDHTIFYCPNGHSQYYPDKSDLEKVRHELAQTKEELFRIKNCAEHKKRRITSLKGVITRMKRND